MRCKEEGIVQIINIHYADNYIKHRFKTDVFFY